MKKIFNHIMALAIAVTFTSTGIFAAELEEIIVTAQKREQNLQDVAVSVTVISGEKIANAALHNLTQLSTYIPNFSVSENAITTIASMRGIGPGANQSFEQSVGLFVDGVHLAKGRQYRTGLFDVERVEVLRGPQGVLFGKNTLAGAINVVSAKANVGEEFGGRISIGAEGNGGELIEGNVHGTMSKNFALRLSFKDRQEDGWIDNLYNGETSPTTDETMVRLSGTWQPSDDFSLSFRHTDGDNVRKGSTALVTHWEPLFPILPVGCVFHCGIRNDTCIQPRIANIFNSCTNKTSLRMSDFYLIDPGTVGTITIEFIPSFDSQLFQFFF